jgi:hypothetical protein
VVRLVQINGKQTLKLFPNPAKDFVQLRWLNPRNESTTIELINLQGTRVWQSRINTAALQLPVSGFARGLYQIRITRNGLTETQKILLQ